MKLDITVLSKWGKKVPKWSENAPFPLYFTFLSLFVAKNAQKCVPYCRISDKIIHMSRKILIFEFLGLEALGELDHSILQVVISGEPFHFFFWNSPGFIDAYSK